MRVLGHRRKPGNWRHEGKDTYKKIATFKVLFLNIKQAAEDQ